jgi:hypothetical protein
MALNASNELLSQKKMNQGSDEKEINSSEAHGHAGLSKGMK